MNTKICVLCGKQEATTREHIPPKAIFPRPRSDNLITVPACFECNNSSSSLDENFMVHLGLHVSSTGAKGERVFDERVLPTLRHNSKLRNSIMSQAQSVKVANKNGSEVSEFLLSQWDSEAHSTVLEKTIRGLFYHHYDKILDDSSEVKTHWFYSLTPEMIEMSQSWASNVIGSNDVVYRYTSASKGSMHKSVWLFEFFGAHWAGGQTDMVLQNGHS